MRLTSALAKGSVVAAVAGALALATVAPAIAAPAQTAQSSAYVGDGTVLGQSVIRLWETNADGTTPSDSEGGTLSLGPLTFNGATSESTANLATGAVTARASMADARFNLGQFAGSSLVLRISTLGASCSIAEDGSVTATSSTPFVTLDVTTFLGTQSLSIPFVDGVATVGFAGLNLGTVELGQADRDVSDGIVGATGARVTFLNVGSLQAGSMTIGSASCGPVVPLQDVPAIDPALAASIGGIGLLAFGAHRLVIGRRERLATH